MEECKMIVKEGRSFYSPPNYFFMQGKSTKKSKRIEYFTLVNPHAAGIDVGDTEMVVAVSPGLCDQNVRTFGAFTSDYEQIVSWLQECKITQVALESTGVYWIQLYLLLQEKHFEVTLANAKHIKNVSGRKDDENDAMWIQRLHSFGLISGSFQPDLQTRGLRDLMRHRRSLVQDQSRCTNRIIKALELMNIKIHTVVSDIDGKTGRIILEAILNGERDAVVLASLADCRIRASQEKLIKSLQGNWNPLHLFLLKQQYNTHEFQSAQIKELDIQIEKQLQVLTAFTHDGEISSLNPVNRKRSTRKNAIPFHATAHLNALLGVDITSIPGISEVSALEIISEIGTDMSRWPTEDHFTSWLGIVPNTKKSGGKIISNKIMKKKHRAGQALRVAAMTLRRSKSELGNFYRRKQAKGGPSKAILATATKIAIAIYMMIKNKVPYQAEKLKMAQEKFKLWQIRKLENRLEQLKSAA
jgi:transposase